MDAEDEDLLLRSVALQNAASIRAARQRAEQELHDAKDALERRTAELQDRERQLSVIYENVADAIFYVAVEPGGFRFLSVNRAFESLTGRPGKEVSGRLITDIVPEDVRATVVQNYTRAIIEKRSIHWQQSLRFPAGVKVGAVSVAPIFDDHGVCTNLIGTVHDITEQKKAEDALREETRLLDLLNRSGTALASNLDSQSLLQAITDAATQLSGARFGAFFYNVLDDKGGSYMLYTLSGAPREAFEKFGQPRATPVFAPTFKGEGTIRSDNIQEDPRYGKMGPHHGQPPGHLPVRSYLAVPVISRTGEVMGGLFFGHPEVGVFTERSARMVEAISAHAAVALDNARLYEAARQSAEERKSLLESERAARTEAERTGAIKDEFLATLSHELRTPLSAILGWVQVLRRRAFQDEETPRALETIERNARMQVQLIEDLLDMSRITSGKVRLDIQPLDPQTFIEAALETVRPAAEAKQMRLKRILDSGAGPIAGDPDRLQQVMSNLLTNAVKFTPKGGMVQVLLERVNSHVEISVADTGAGIAAELVPHLFERFRQGDASTTRKYGGLGLGLSIVKSLVELHGGTVQVASPGEGRGATFTVRLPVTVVHRSQELPVRQHPRASASLSEDFKIFDLSDLKVVVVDDEPDGRNLICRVLVECGATALAAASAREALALIEKHMPDVVVTDIGMPEEDGYELLRQMHHLPPERGGRIPAIALTAFARSEDRTRALRSGFLLHLAKPVEPAELVATVASAASRGRL